MTSSPARRAKPHHLLAAFATGCLLTLMVHLNGELAFHGGALFASFVAHGVGMVAALLFLAVGLRGTSSAGRGARAPFWAYLGGLSGAATVIATATAVNTPLALSGTLALGLAGQVSFSLAADRWGLFGLPVRRPTSRDFAALACILAGSALIIFAGRGAA
ncbi:DMT family transporter [Aureimonas psammosilenae]|uniref:DMT family transporter n=1 Tax=Aureimonas psammosilenae TaxID=2495496 RepID=UPI001260434B|nr:DMT family transporter [Aureimonas psammosilenae]